MAMNSIHFIACNVKPRSPILVDSLDRHFRPVAMIHSITYLTPRQPMHIVNRRYTIRESDGKAT
jgi:hypothetical protein